MSDEGHTLTIEQARSFQLFGDLPQADLEAVAARCRVRRLDAGEHVLHLHEETSELFFVLRGSVRVLLYSPGGRDVSFRDLRDGEVFGELAAIDGGPRSASVVANEESALAVMSRNAFMELALAHPSVAKALLNHLVSLIRRYSQRVYELSALSVEERIRMQILRMAWERSDGASSVTLEPAPSLADLASIVSTTREAVSREISRLARERLVERKGRNLVVHDIARLSATVESELA